MGFLGVLELYQGEVEEGSIHIYSQICDGQHFKTVPVSLFLAYTVNCLFAEQT